MSEKLPKPKKSNGWGTYTQSGNLVEVYPTRSRARGCKDYDERIAQVTITPKK